MSQAIKSSKYRIAIFASGAGSNAKKIIEYFSQSSFVSVDLIVCNNPDAGVLKIAESNHITAIVLEKEKFFRGNCYVDELTEARIDLIVLAGFLWKVPALLVKAFSGKIINIHPALLPGYGGKGMYGSHVHEAVITAGDKKSGITIHYVDEIYDHGKHIFQATCAVSEDETPGTLAAKIHVLEHAHYPKVIEDLLLNTGYAST